jgi:hypothetical protein
MVVKTEVETEDGTLNIGDVCVLSGCEAVLHGTFRERLIVMSGDAKLALLLVLGVVLIVVGGVGGGGVGVGVG